MAETIRVGIIGGGWPGMAHAKGYQAAGGFKLIAVADLIPDRRLRMMNEFAIPRQYASADDLLADKDVQAVSVCVPNHLHVAIVTAALKSGKHVVCESPPAMDAREARRMEAAAQREGKILLYAMQRRYGPSEQAAHLAINKGFAGEVYHARASWTRTRAVPAGTGWYTDKSKSGGGAMIDLGVHMLDLAWHLLGEPKPESVYAATHQRFKSLAPAEAVFDVEDAAFMMLRFEGGKSLELAVSWAANQPPAQNGSICRVHGEAGAVEVYTPQGAVLYRDFDAKGNPKAVPLKPPKFTHHVALLKHFRQCVIEGATPQIGPVQGSALMSMVDAIYKSAAAGKSVVVQ